MGLGGTPDVDFQEFLLVSTEMSLEIVMFSVQ